MRYYLDTNILVFLISEGEVSVDLSRDVRAILFDYTNILYTSSECVRELINLCQSGKVATPDDIRKKPLSAIIGIIDSLGIEIKYMNRKHLERLADLPMRGNNLDPIDRFIVAQAISDRIPLISSDGKFSGYVGDGLEFIYNER